MNKFSEESIRPLEISKKCAKLMKEEIFDPVSKKIKEDIAEYTNCLACG